MTPDDITLLREYVASQSESAFATLVRRHIHHVHSTAIRRVSDPHLAEEITQAVFIILAQKAKSLGSNTILSGWLYRTTLFVAKDAIRGKWRRAVREQEAYMQSTLNEPDENVWAEISPLLDNALNSLSEADRTALVLKFFENKSAHEIADILRLKDNAAQKRIGRALEKLRAFFARRGVTATTAKIAETISTNSVHAAPTVLLQTTTAMALAKGATTSTSALMLAKGTLQLMTWAKVKTAVAKISLVALAAIMATLTVNKFRDISRQVSPFTMVQFDENNSNKVVVTYGGHEYQLIAVDGLSVKDILNFCRQQYGRPPFDEDWAEKRFAEDLVVVLSEMNHPVNSGNTVSLTLIEPQTGKKIIIAYAPMTRGNRQAIFSNRSLVR